MVVLRRLWGSRAVWVAAAGLFSTVLLEGSDGQLTQVDVDQIIGVIKLLGGALIAKWGAEDFAEKLPLPPPKPPPEVVTADHG